MAEEVDEDNIGWNKRIRTKERGEQLQDLVEKRIDGLCERLNLGGGVNNVAKAIYIRSLDKSVIENRSLSDITSAAVYCAIRIENEPITTQEVCEVSNSNYKMLSRTYADLSSELGLKTGPVDPEKYVSIICGDLDLSSEVSQKAKEILDRVKDEEVHIGKNPKGVAAGSVYMSSLLCNERRTQREVADAAGISQRTLSSGYQEQFLELDIHSND